MSQIQYGQDYQLILETNQNITAMVTTEIHYRKPGSKRVYTESSTVINTTQMYIIIEDTDNLPAGQWYFQSYAVDNTGKVYRGKPVNMYLPQKLSDIRS